MGFKMRSTNKTTRIDITYMVLTNLIHFIYVYMVCTTDHIKKGTERFEQDNGTLS
jgi:hypothetical protein